MVDTVPGSGARALPSTGRVLDSLDRPLRDLRVSVTDRCNFRCVYCMPREIFGRDYTFLAREQLLSFEEITRVVRAGMALGVEKVRLTGGEPLLRKGIVDLVAQLRHLRTPTGNRLDLALTTNGSALTVLAEPLASAGLDRITVSLDSLDDATFRAMNDVNFPVARVLAGIDAAVAAGLGLVKVNTVVKRNLNDGDILDLAAHFRGTSAVLRFIEYMDVGSTNGWRLDDVVPSREVLERIDAVFPLEPLAARTPGETSTRYRYRDGAGEIGFISSVTKAFCGSCNRARLSTEGSVFTCLFASEGFDLRALLRAGCSDDDLETALRSLWLGRDDRYSEVRSSLTPELRTSRRHVEMSYIGG